MVKVFISQPMRGKTDEEILKKKIRSDRKSQRYCKRRRRTDRLIYQG